MEKLQGILADLPYHEGPDAALKSESVFRNVVACIFLLSGKYVHMEKHTSQGRIGSVVETPEPSTSSRSRSTSPWKRRSGRLSATGTPAIRARFTESAPSFPPKPAPLPTGAKCRRDARPGADNRNLRAGESPLALPDASRPVIPIDIGGFAPASEGSGRCGRGRLFFVWKTR